MRKKFITIGAHLVDVASKFSWGCAEVTEYLGLESGLVRYDISPEVLFFSIAKELAPFDHSHIDKVAVDRDPEWPPPVS